MEEKPFSESVILAKYGNYINLRLIGELTDAQAALFVSNTLPEILAANLNLVINCNYLTKLSPAWLPALTLADKSIRKINFELRFILLKTEIRKTFEIQGLWQLSSLSTNLREALLSLKLIRSKSLDVGFINPFLDATLHVLGVQAKIAARAGKLFLKKDFSELSGDISGVIGLVSDSFTGNVIISFPEKTFLGLISKMFLVDCTSINSENADGAAELSNMIFGQAKLSLNEQGYGIKTALPSLIIGKSHRISVNKQELTVVVPFESDIGNFYVEISVADNILA